MNKITIEDLRFLSSLSQILGISASKKIEIVKKEKNDQCVFLGIKDTENSKIILSVDIIDQNKITGDYVSWLTDEPIHYIIKRLFNNIFILQTDIELKFLQSNIVYSDPIKSIIIQGIKVIELSAIKDLQILTEQEFKNGIQLVKRNKLSKNS